MKSKMLVVFIVLNILFQSCVDNECEDIACFTPPSGFVFELVDANTKEDLFVNQTFKANDIKVVDLTTGDNIEFEFIDENNISLIRIPGIGWETELVNAQISIVDTVILNLIVDAERVSEDCCSFTKYNNIEIENATFELDSETGVYRIFVSQ